MQAKPANKTLEPEKANPAKDKDASRQFLLEADKLLKESQFDLARKQLEKAKELDPSNPYIYAFQDRIEEQRRRDLEARAVVEERLRRELELRITAEEQKRKELEERKRKEAETREVEDRQRKELEARALAEEQRRKELEARIAVEERCRRELEERIAADDRRRRDEEMRLEEERRMREIEGRAAAEERRRKELEAKIALDEKLSKELEAQAGTTQKQTQASPPRGAPNKVTAPPVVHSGAAEPSSEERKNIDEMRLQIEELTKALEQEKRAREEISKHNLQKAVQQLRSSLEAAWVNGAPVEKAAESLHELAISLTNPSGSGAIHYSRGKAGYVQPCRQGSHCKAQTAEKLLLNVGVAA